MQNKIYNEYDLKKYSLNRNLFYFLYNANRILNIFLYIMCIFKY